MFKKLTILSLVSLLLIFNINVNIKALDDDFDYNICNSDLSNADSETIQACTLYIQEIGDDVTNLEKKVSSIQKELEENKKNIKNSIRKVSEYEDELKVIEKKIKSIEENIALNEENIESIGYEINIRQKEVDLLNENVKERMIAMQSFMHINNYIDFLVGSSSFVDFIRRVEAIKDIQAYDNQLIEDYNKEIAILNSDADELKRQAEILEQNKKDVEANKKYYQKLQETVEEMLKEYYKQEAELEAQEAELLSDLSEVQAAYEKAAKALGTVTSSSSWLKPISGGRISSSTWYYPKSFGGGVHLGIDVAASVGTTIKAVANGYVLFSIGKFDTYGYLGSSAGSPGSSGGGNQLYLICSVKDKVYAIKYLHMKKNTPIAAGQIVTAGTKIGEVGSSGNSSGPHCHIEIFYLGTKSLSYYIQHWNGDFAFGCGWGSNGLKRTCDKTGAPCRMAPKSVLGY